MITLQFIRFTSALAPFTELPMFYMVENMAIDSEPLFEENPDIPLYIVNSLIYRFIDRSTTIGTVLVVVHVNH
jgi:hypothetical protein